MKQYVATLRAIFTADDEVEAIVIAEQVRQNGEKELEPEDGDSLDVSDVFPSGFGLGPAETCMVVRAARNALIRTRIKQCFDQARELDKIAWVLEHRLEEHFDISGYPFGEFMVLATKVLEGKDPEEMSG